ncbi:hypothetical protein HC928_03260 [bacterium]|nr:hypothetical protein [bacterium]
MTQCQPLLRMFAETVSPTGSISSKGILNQLGRPKLDTLAVLVRETVQNTWDARLFDEHPVTYTVHGRELTTLQQSVLRDVVFRERPEPKSLSLAPLDRDQPLCVLSISDRGTTGLAGPTRADRVPNDAQRNFISFLRDVGQPANKDFAGGTYGYGKASLYRASGLQTILVYTRCANAVGRLESRFIGAALGERWASPDERQYTGRIWWGQHADDTVDPVLDEVADNLAVQLGLEPFAANETGTTILILDPLFHDRNSTQHADASSATHSPIHAINKMAEYALYCFWPKMLLDANGNPAIQFHFRWEDTPVTIPDPRSYPPLVGFVAAMDHLKGKESDNVLQSELYEVQSQRPKQDLGRLALHQFLVEKGEALNTGEAQSLFAELTHHTALMRRPELVVKYYAGKPMPTTTVGYAGVFITDEKVDTIFAQAEPPTHDDWIPDYLANRPHKTFVNVALRQIREHMTQFAQSARPTVPSGTLKPLGEFATWLGESLMPMQTGTSASRNRQRPAPAPRTAEIAPPIPTPELSLPYTRDRVGTADTGSYTVLTGIDTKSTTALPPPAALTNADDKTNTPVPYLGGEGHTGADTADTTPDSTSTLASPSQSNAPMEPKQADITNPRPRKPIRGVSQVIITDSGLIEHAEQPALLVTFLFATQRTQQGQPFA